MGSKCYFLEGKGIYILEEGEGTFRSLACTHVGAGSFTIFDGVCDSNGFFPEEEKLKNTYAPAYWTANGRKLFGFSPQCMGFWAVDGGFSHGLTAIADGGPPGMAVFITVSWVKYKPRTATPGAPGLIRPAE